MSEYIGSKVAIPGTRGYGTLKYYGPIEGKQGLFAGIELTGPIAASRGKNNGSVNGIQYFDVIQPMSGLFLPIDRLKQANPQIGGSSGSNGLRNSLSSTSSLNKKRLSSDSIPDSPASESIISPSPNKVNPRVSLGSFQRLSYSPTQQSINIQKRDLRYTNSPISSPQLNTSSLPQNAPLPTEIMDIKKLQKEYNELKLKYDINEREMNEKMEILNELRITVNDLQPLLEEYEIDISEKDKKLSRQKSEFERAREEWRSSIQLLVNTHEETEILYDQKFRELREYIERLLKEKDDISNNNQITTPTSNSSSKKIYHGDDHESEIERLNLVIHDLNLEHHLLEKNYTAKIQSLELQILDYKEKLSKTQDDLDEFSKSNYHQFTKSVDNGENSEKIEELEYQINLLKQDKASFEFTITDLQKKLKQKDLIITELEIKLDSSNDKENVKELSNDLNSLKLSDPNDEVIKLNHKIDDLNHQLEIRPTFEELSDLQKSLDELDTLHENELNTKSIQINSLSESNKDLENQLNDFKQKNIELEDKIKTLQQLNQSSLIQLESENIAPNSLDGLPIYKPAAPIDPSAGKDDWCGLCERDGHSSINCPYENDVF